MSYIYALLSSLSTVALLCLLGYVCRNWLIERLKASIKFEYDQKLLAVEHERETRLKGEVVAELLAQWIRKGGNLDYFQLNRLSFQAFIWLPRPLAEKLSNALAHKSGAEDIRSLIKDLRVHLHGTDDGLEARDVIVFNEPNVHSSVNFSSVTSAAVTKPKPLR